MTIHLPLATALLILSSFPADAQKTVPGAQPSPRETRTAASAVASPSVLASYGKLPLSFEVNQGQVSGSTRFISHGSGYSLSLTDSAAMLALAQPDPRGKLPSQPAGATSGLAFSATTDILRMELVNAVQGRCPEGADRLPGTANYFSDKDPAKWHTNIPTYAQVKYAGVYPGVDLVYYGRQGQLEYDFIVAPGANPKQVRLRFAGAKNLTLDRNGDLIIAASHGQIAFHKPVVYQTVGSQRQSVHGRFTLAANNTVSFALGNYDRTRELVIDPILAYSTYYSSVAGGYNIAVDTAGEVFFAGSQFFVSENQYRYKALITKLNTTGTAVLYTASFGTINGSSGGIAIAIDAAGDAYVAGATGDEDFPTTTHAYQRSYRPGFILKLDPTGSKLLYSTYMGGIGENQSGRDDFLASIVLDGNNDAIVTGFAASTDFPVTPNAFQKVNKTKSEYGGNAFVLELNSSGETLNFSTYLGGSALDNGVSVAVDSAGSAYVTGTTTSTDFPITPGSLRTTNDSVYTTGFVTKLTPDGSALVYSTYLGGPDETSYYAYPGGDNPAAIAVNSTGHAFVTGQSASGHFPVTPGAFLTTNYANSAFVSKLEVDGSALLYSTYLNGPSTANSYVDSVGTGIAVDPSGYAVVTGWTVNDAFPVTADAPQKEPRNPTATAFLSLLNDAGSALIFSTYLGGSGQQQYEDFNATGDEALAIALDPLGNVYMTGTTASKNFPVTPTAYGQPPPSDTIGNFNAFITKFAFHGGTRTTLTSDANPHSSASNVVFTATVTPVTSGAAPTGVVSFSIDGLLTPVDLDSTGTAVLSVSLAAGSHSIIANYLGDPAMYSASSAGLTETVN